jgi:hypothetical protein
MLLHDLIPRLDIAVPDASREPLAFATGLPRSILNAVPLHLASGATLTLHFQDGRIHGAQPLMMTRSHRSSNPAAMASIPHRSGNLRLTNFTHAQSAGKHARCSPPT